MGFCSQIACASTLGSKSVGFRSRRLSAFSSGSESASYRSREPASILPQLPAVSRASFCGHEFARAASFASSACREGLGIFSLGLSTAAALPADAVMSATSSIPHLTCLRHLRSQAALSAHPLSRPRSSALIRFPADI